MSSDYRPKGGSNRRRRGGRGRSPYNGENRSRSNGASHSAPKKEQSPIGKLFSWLFGKKKQPAGRIERAPSFSESKPREVREPRAPREHREPREPRAERPRREEKAEVEVAPQEIVSPKLYVGNLPYEAAESDLFDLFSKTGAVKNVEIAMDRRTGRSKGFGFVEMEALDSAKEAAEKLNRTDFMGRQIVVSGAKLDRRLETPRQEDSSSDTTA